MGESFNTRLGLEIKQARLAANLSQEKLAELLDVDRTYISFLESGKRSPSIETFSQLLNHLDIKLNFLPDEWLQKLYSVCREYNLEIENLADTINDPKVIPMLRGKAFEFSACNVLRKNLPKNKYQVSNPKLNAQSSIRDIDIELHDLISSKKYAIECKLSKKGSFRSKVAKNEDLVSIQDIAKSKDLAVYENSNSKCSRKKCNNKNNCGFIPNYPYIYFDKNTGKVIEPWV